MSVPNAVFAEVIGKRERDNLLFVDRGLRTLAPGGGNETNTPGRYRIPEGLA